MLYNHTVLIINTDMNMNTVTVLRSKQYQALETEIKSKRSGLKFN